MEFRQFRYFIAVAQELSFSRAAKRLHVSQPPLSRQVSSLEEELGVRLLNRNKHKVSLTDAGSLFLIHAQDVVEGIETAATMARKVARGEIGRLVLGYGGVAAYTHVPTMLRRFREEYPAVKISLDQMPLVDQLDALRSRRIDIGFVLMPCAERAVSTELMTRDTLVVAVPPDHSLARQAGVRTRQLASCDFVMFPRNKMVGYQRYIVDLCRRAGFMPNIVKEAHPMESLVGLVASGFGIAIVPAMAKRIQSANITYVPILDKNAYMDFGFAWNKDNLSPVLRQFMATARSVLKSPTKRRRPIGPR
jgi:LysR family transcriptional regulator, benzoate and cis,cis-muconate-responsive activator of ben and cat genes